uniref:Neur_chan_LBD domain-containing protein n=1 Tax=Panagrellus redivivus TaxID=6233 RepID=A0A7E4VUT2_PANRE
MLYWYLWLASNLIRLSLSDEDLVRLYRNLLKDYEKDVRPSLRHDIPINVTFEFSLTQIIDVDERNQIITTNAWVRQSWFDYKMIWDPADYNNVTKMHIPYRKVWRPDIILYTNADSAYSKSVMSTDAVVSFDGNVSWTMAGIFKSSCKLDVRYYPFDEQRCSLTFASWAYDGTKIDIVLESDTGDQTNYMKSTEWVLRNIGAEKNKIVYSCCPEPYPYVNIHINIQRRPMFYVFNLIVPCVLTSAIALLGFYMPSDSGEKVTLGITSLLSTTVFLMLVAEGMPPTSEALPLIGLYYGVTIFIVSLATAMTVFTLNIHHHGVHGRSVPLYVQKIAFQYVAKLLFLKLDEYHSINHHIQYFFNKEHNIQKKDSIFYTERSISTVKVTPQPVVDETRLSLVSRTGANSISSEQNVLSSPSPAADAGKKRVSFSNDSINSLPPNGSCSHGFKPSPSRSHHEYHSDTFEDDFFGVLDKIHQTIERNEMRIAEKDRRDAAQLEWQQVALVLDRFLLIVFVIGTAITSVTILYQKQLNFG